MDNAAENMWKIHGNCQDSRMHHAVSFPGQLMADSSIKRVHGPMVPWSIHSPVCPGTKTLVLS